MAHSADRRGATSGRRNWLPSTRTAGCDSVMVSTMAAFLRRLTGSTPPLFFARMVKNSRRTAHMSLRLQLYNVTQRRHFGGAGS